MTNNETLQWNDKEEVRKYILTCLTSYRRWDHRPDVEGYRKSEPVLDLVISEMIWNNEMVRRRNRNVRNTVHGGMPARIWELPRNPAPVRIPKVQRERRGFRPSGKSILVIDYLLEREVCEYAEIVEALRDEICHSAMRTYVERLEDCGLVEVGPFWQMSPVDSRYSSYRKNSLCLRATALLKIRMRELGLSADADNSPRESVVKKLQSSLASGRELRHPVYFSTAESNFLLACIRKATGAKIDPGD